MADAHANPDPNSSPSPSPNSSPSPSPSPSPIPSACSSPEPRKSRVPSPSPSLYTQVTSNFDSAAGKVESKWFDGGKTNICYNALDRHVKAGHGDQVCFHHEGNEESDELQDWTYQQALDEVSKVANVLKARGVVKGDTVMQHGQSAPLAGPQFSSCASSGRACRLWAARQLPGRGRPPGRPATASAARASRLQSRWPLISPPLTTQVTLFMPMVPQLPIAMLACARIGAVHSVVFGGFSAEALSGRLIDAQSTVILTANGVMRGKKPIPLYEIVNAAADICGEACMLIDTMIVLQRLPEEQACRARATLARTLNPSTNPDPTPKAGMSLACNPGTNPDPDPKLRTRTRTPTLAFTLALSR